MHSRPKWQYDEFKHCGVDFSNLRQVEGYDRDHGKFRDFKKDSEWLIGYLGLTKDHTLIDMGCGTGAFCLYAAGVCRKVHAVDVSRPMLEYCRKKVKRAGLANVAYHHAGFLTYEHAGTPADAVVSVVAMHHLPDFWKLVGLRRIYDMLKPEGKFYLMDVVYSFDMANHQTCLDGMVRSLKETAGAKFSEEAITTIRDEYPTLSWIMEGLIRQAGFRIVEANCRETLARYLCIKDPK